MNFVESLSLASGLKIGRPRIETSFFPVAPKRYITIHSENHQSKQWDHFQEFINLINPYLAKKNISIVELGWNDHQLKDVYSVKNVTDPKHAAFILKNSLLHIGPENFLIQLASFYGKPFVSLFSNTTPDYARPLWSGDDESAYLREIIIESGRGGRKPSFAGEENPKTINSISAEEVASQCLALLNIANPFDGLDIVFTGTLYHTLCIEAIPNFRPADDFFPRSLLNLRLDYDFNEDNIPFFANNRKLSLISYQPISLPLLQSIKPAVEALFFQVDESFDLDYLGQIKPLGIPLHLIAQPSSNLPETRLKFFDWKVEEEVKINKKKLDNHSKICDTTRYKSSKMLFSEGKKYSSKSAWLNQVESHEDEMILDDDDFWSESDHFKLYNIHD